MIGVKIVFVRFYFWEGANSKFGGPPWLNFFLVSNFKKSQAAKRIPVAHCSGDWQRRENASLQCCRDRQSTSQHCLSVISTYIYEQRQHEQSDEKKWYVTRNTLDCDQSNVYSSCVIFSKSAFSLFLFIHYTALRNKCPISYRVRQQSL